MRHEADWKSEIIIGKTDGPVAVTEMKRSGIDVLGALPWGTHFCQFYETPEDLIDVLVPYFTEGLLQNEFCMWVTSEPLRAEEAGAALRRSVPDLGDRISRGQIEILDYSRWYTPSGKFDADRVLAGWIEKERRALELGYDGLRLTGNTFWLERSDWDSFASYEATVDGVINSHRMMAICTYAIQRCSALEVIEVVNNHQFALIKRAGRWEVMESRQRKRVEQALRESDRRLQEHTRTLEQRVKQRTAELHAASRYARSLIEASLDPLVTISPEGKITDVNKATELATGVTRERLIGSDFSSYFTEPGKADQGYRQVLTNGLVRDYPLTIRHASGLTMDVLYNATVYRNDEGALQGVFAAARDITERLATHRRQSVTSSLLELFARKNSRKVYLDSVVEVVRDWSECRCVGIRVPDEDGNLCYESQVGFEDGFFIRGNDLSLKRDACFCIRAMTGLSLDSDMPLRTPGGSFRCDDLGEFMHGIAPDRRGSYRDACALSGFASLAAIPIRYRDRTLGVVHLADSRRAIATSEKVEFIESMAPLIGEAIHRFNAEAELRTYREHLEELVARRTDELARSNKDLEQFAYAASHDMQEPLRMVSAYLQLLNERYGGQLDDKAHMYIGFAVDGAQRMSALIRDLLAFARVNTRSDEPQAMDAGNAVDAAMKNLGSAIRDGGAEVTKDQLPVVRADITQLTQLFQNLIGNAVKFRSSDRPPRIHVAAEELEKEWVFSVRDNGIGFDQRYHEKLFQIFQRLHGPGQYPGTGIGLAICKRIVERHGGRIWASGEPGQGSVFLFTIPKIR